MVSSFVCGEWQSLVVSVWALVKFMGYFSVDKPHVDNYHWLIGKVTHVET